ncbi:nucleotide sugar dehydrogenase [Natronococcus pandeyae]|uniref:UDP-N-acetyl-D-mannosamine dehydrogenase n=1 Tax=Natronococcus pandeyae TaxID=2055836 RepID=A0A8J8Q3V3_9EURY|nr:nucleotide sugar dehydrogenase [Natronococcus pandeyae]TYL38941.1 nucleotide sugar dehydrogenase [Natronococcus pandeyae]
MTESRTVAEERLENRDVQISCIGLGFVGYNSALEFSRAEYPVVGIDTDDGLIEAIRRGDSPFETAELAEFIEDGESRVSTQISDAADAEVYVISVPTPVDADNTPNLSYVRSAARDVSTVLDPGNLVVLQSTVYPGCARHELVPELEHSGLEPADDFGVSHVPERYSPGDGPPNRATRVVGSITEGWRDLTADLYEDVADSTAPVSSLEVAEATKLMENTQRDVNIALMNEFSIAAERIGIDVWEVIESAATKWNFQPYEPGLGVGGHCLPVDPHYLREAAEAAGTELRLVSTAREINSSMPDRHVDNIFLALDAIGKSPSSATVAVLGVTYKPNVRDVRNSSALELIHLLRDENVSVEAFDPQFEPGERIERTELSNQSSAMDAVRNADVVVIATGHRPFHRLDPSALAATMRSNPILVDPQRTLDPDAVSESRLISPQELGTHFIPDLGAVESDGGVSALDDGEQGCGQ